MRFSPLFPQICIGGEGSLVLDLIGLASSLSGSCCGGGGTWQGERRVLQRETALCGERPLEWFGEKPSTCLPSAVTLIQPGLELPRPVTVLEEGLPQKVSNGGGGSWLVGAGGGG